MSSRQSKRWRALLEFSVHSLSRAYGHVFLQHMILRHPLRTVRGLQAYWRATWTSSTEQRALSQISETTWLERVMGESEQLLVATGFCQKPLRTANGGQECPAGRFNHNCLYLAQLSLDAPAPQLNPACAACPIRILGYASLQAGACFAILTSALDIARDILLPSLQQRRFSHVLFAICPYSLEPMTLALLLCGLDGYLFSYEAGVCGTYSEWLRADHGDKPEQSSLSGLSQAGLLYLLDTIAAGRAKLNLSQYTEYRHEANVFRPI